MIGGTPPPRRTLPRWRPHVAAAVLASALVLGALAACTALIGADEPQCRTDGDCTARGEPFAGSTCSAGVCRYATLDASVDAAPDALEEVDSGPWGCIGKVSTRPKPEAGAVTLLHVRIVDGSTVTSGQDPDEALRRAKGLSAARIRLCSSLDVDCERPFSIGDASVAVADDDGRVDIYVPSDFEGYFDIQRTEFVRLRVFLGGPPSQLDPDFMNAMVSESTLSTLGAVLGVPSNPDAGLVSVGSHDCTGKFAAGVSYEIAQTASDTVPFYIIDGLPSTTDTQTGPSSAGGFLNAPAGPYDISVKVAATGQRVGSKRILVRPGGQTHLTFLAR